MIVCAGDIESFRFATPIGIGLVNSAINLTKICLLDRPEFILFVGTAGSYGKHQIFDIVESSAAANIELSFWQDNSYTPLQNVLYSDTKIVQNQTIVNSSNYITTSSELSKSFAPHNIGIENMEFYSCLSVAKEFGIDIGGLFVVTNYTDKNAHKDFMDNRVEAMEKLTNYLIDNGVIK
jgi:nucleoside phosphorylase